MSVRRVVLVVTCLVAAGLGVVFAMVQWDTSSRVATVASALAAVASVGVAVWAALPTSDGAQLQVSNTGHAMAGRGGTAVSGVTGPAGLVSRVEVDHTGDADASGDGEATSGARLT